MDPLKIFEKRPVDEQDYDISFTEWMNRFSPADTMSTIDVAVDSGITAVVDPPSSGVVKVKLIGGTAGYKYLVKAKLTTTYGRVKEVCIAVVVK